jgi:nicotinamidase-related amidase
VNRREHLKITAAAALAAAAIPSSFAQAKSQKPTIDSSRSALIFIEFQHEWLDHDSPLNRMIEDRPQFEDAVQNATQIIEQARRSNFSIVHAGLSLIGDPTYKLFGNGNGKSGLKGAIPRAGTWRDPQRVAFHEPFVPKPGEFVVAGRSGASVLTNSNLDAYLGSGLIDQSQKMTVAARATAEKKAFGHRS